jgi:hypothetical protein
VKFVFKIVARLHEDSGFRFVVILQVDRGSFRIVIFSNYTYILYTLYIFDITLQIETKLTFNITLHDYNTNAIN